MATQNARVLFALKTLRENGINTVENVAQEIEKCEQSCTASAADYLIEDLRDFLEVQTGDAHRNVCEWISQQGWFWNCVQAYPEVSDLFSSISSSEAEVSEDETPEPAHAEDVIAAASLLQAELSSITCASASVSLDIASECHTDFSLFINQSKCCSDDHDVATKYVRYPTQTRSDMVMGEVSKKILLQSSFMMSTEEKEMELIVNLLAEGPEGKFTNFTIVTSQGEMKNLDMPEMHTAVTNVASVQRCYTLASALNSFQRTMLSVAEHLITLAPQEFISEISVDNVSVSDSPSDDENQSCCYPALSSPLSQPSEAFLSACNEEISFSYQESNESFCPLTPLMCPQ